MVTEVARRLFTVEEYHRIKADILGKDDRVELIDGEIFEMSPAGYRHWGSILRATHLLTAKLEGRALIGIQLPIELDDRSEPQPDVAVLRWTADFFASTQGALPTDILFLIEVSDSSLSYDLHKKRAKYAKARMPEYWVLDVVNERLLVFRKPQGEDYDVCATLTRDQAIAPLAFPDVSIAVHDLLVDSPRT